MQFKAFIYVVLLFWGSQVLAQENRTFFFEADWGEQIQVDIIGTSNDPKYLIYAAPEADKQLLFKQLVKSTMQQRNYIYVQSTNCNPICQHNTPAPDKSFLAPGETNELIESVASAIGTRDIDAIVDAVADELTGNKTIRSSAYTIVTLQNDKPIAMCRMVGEFCSTIPNVTFLPLDGEGWRADFPAMTIGGDNAIFLAISQFIQQNSSIKCKTVYDNNEPPRVQVTCLPTKLQN